MRYLAAGDLLEASRDACEGEVRLRVVSVHAACLNCSDGAGRRWSILADRDDLQPRSIVVKRLPDVSAGDVLVIDTNGATVSFDPAHPDIVINGRWGALLTEWPEYLLDEDLVDISRYFCVTSLSGLIGLGPGLTPAGDDFVTGWITASGYSAIQENAELVDRFREDWNPKATTWFSGWMIEDALNGRIWRRGALLLEALGVDDAGCLSETLRNILEWGHTSGRAWLAGFGAALSSPHWE